jgi:hypothetical protein|tara:strand:+ start:1 stop:1074 length:1074 start_codon:yes stop_codon:yes gene_type:complete
MRWFRRQARYYAGVSSEIELEDQQQHPAGSFACKVKNAVGDTKHSIEGVTGATTIDRLRVLIAEATEVEVERQRLFVKGKMVVRGTLEENGITGEDWVQLMPRSKRVEAVVAAERANAAAAPPPSALLAGTALAGLAPPERVRMQYDMPDGVEDEVTRLRPTVRVLAMFWFFFSTVSIISLSTHEIIPLIFGGSHVAKLHREFIGKHYHVHTYGTVLMGLDFTRNVLGAMCALWCLSATRIGESLEQNAHKLRAALIGTLVLLAFASASQLVAAAINIGEMPKKSGWGDGAILAARVIINGAPELLFYGVVAFILRRCVLLLRDAAMRRATRIAGPVVAPGARAGAAAAAAAGANVV